MIPLDRLSSSSFPATRLVAVDGAVPRSWREFCVGVGGVAGQLLGRERVILSCTDSWNFAVRLFGALAAGAEVILPANGQPATLAALDGTLVDDDFSAGDGPSHWTLPAGARLVFQTSGSTGTPKRVERSLEQLGAELAALDALWGPGLDGCPTLSTVSHQHVYGLIFGVLWPLVAGRSVLARPGEMWEDILAALPPDGVLVTSPAHLTRMGGLEPVFGSNRPRMVLSAGAALPEAHAAEARRILGVPVTEIYGSTETGAMATRRRDSRDPAWRPLPGYTVSRSAEGLARLDSPAANAEIADRIEWAEDGGFHLRGRADRIVKIEGKRVALDGVEQALAALPQVTASAVLALEGEVPVLAAALVLSPHGRAELDRLGAFRLGRALRRALSDQLEPAARPRRWRFVEALPQAPMGKPSAAGLAALFADEIRLPLVQDIRHPDDGAAELDLYLPPDLFWFRGHFAGLPILPGVVQLDWVTRFARAHLGLDLPAAREFQIKFKAVIGPDQHLTLSLRHDRDKGRLSFGYRRGGEECSSGTVFLS